MTGIELNTLIPELYCFSFEISLKFYTEILGFTVLYTRSEERFAFLEREGAQLMIEELHRGRLWLAGELLHPYGRGINLQIKVSNAQALYLHCKEMDATIFQPLEEKWYHAGDQFIRQLQFIVLDPDGYLLRFAQYVDQKAAT